MTNLGDRFHTLSLFLGLALVPAFACSSSDATNPSLIGGAPGEGGVVASAGGTPGAGGGVVTSGGGIASAGGHAGSGGQVSAAGSATGSGGRTGGRSGTGGRPGTGGSAISGTGGSPVVGGAGGTGVASTARGTGGVVGADAGGMGGTGGTTPGSTTIPTHCSSALPAGAQAADVSSPTSVVGSGTPDSCTFTALNTAIGKGGVITFNCGGGAVTIPITSTLKLSTTVDTVIDGGNTITLDGQGKVQIMNYSHGDFMKSETRVTLQHLTVVNGKTTPTQAIPTAPAPCSQGYDDGEGGGLYMLDGNLTVIDCTFANNQGAQRGPDTGGGAIYITGSKHGALIVGSVFTGNSAANGGGVGGLFATLQIYNSMFRNNKASGDGANSDDASKCSVINNGQNEVGSGGNGGAIYQDGGSSTNIFLCGVDVEGNAAGTGAFGGGVFMTSNDWSGTITVQDSTITGNTGGSWTQVQSGGPDLGTAFGVNAKSSSIVNSTLQGVK